jgi:UDP:flavonoid glycosyltransferase YjiC (YdhE family)
VTSYTGFFSSGVPQVVLPCWFDCYDFASKAELLGIGRWGSKKGCPRWIESELTEALIDVALDNNAEYTAKSRSLAELCGRNGGGRATAADEILRLIDDQVGHS